MHKLIAAYNPATAAEVMIWLTRRRSAITKPAAVGDVDQEKGIGSVPQD